MPTTKTKAPTMTAAELSDRFLKALGEALHGGDPATDQRIAAAHEALRAIGNEHPHLKCSLPDLALVNYLRTTHAVVRELRDRIAALEQRPASMKYCGTWQPGTTYHKGDLVTKSGSLWIADEPTSVMPDNTPESRKVWRLAAMRGKQGPPGPPGKDASQ